MLEKPAFIQGLYSFQAEGLAKPIPLSPKAVYKVPFDKRSQMIYLRAGNPSPELIYLVLLRGGVPMRYFPVGAKGAIHVPLAVVEDIDPETQVEVLAAAQGTGEFTVILDIAFMEIG